MGFIHITSSGKQRHVGGRHRPLLTAATHPDKIRSLKRYCVGGVSLPKAPDAFDYTVAGKGSLENVLANNRLGDCTIAGVLHIEEAISAAAGNPTVFQEADAVRLYSAWTGYDPKDPTTDQGGDEYSILTNWKDKGLDGQGGHKIAGFVAIDPHDPGFVKSVLYLFENLYFGIELATSWAGTPNGGVWDVGSPPNPNMGHCVVGLAATPEGVIVDTWGEFITITWAAIESFCADSAGGQLFAVLTPEIVARAQGKSPSGLDWAGLVDDFNALALPVTPPVDDLSVAFEDTDPPGPIGPAARS